MNDRDPWKMGTKIAMLMLMLMLVSVMAMGIVPQPQRFSFLCQTGSERPRSKRSSSGGCDLISYNKYHGKRRIMSFHFAIDVP